MESGRHRGRVTHAEGAHTEGMYLPLRIASAMATAIGVLAPVATAQFGSALQPRTYTSPDARGSLFVDPTQPSGGGPGKYEYRHDGAVVWAGELPWSFADAVLADDGTVAGFAYPDGGGGALRGSFHAVVLGPDGTTRLDDVTQREGSRFLHTPSNPLGAGMFLHQGNARVAFRVFDADVNRRREEWWIARLPDAKSLERLRPRDLLPEKDPRDVILALAEVPKTPLTIVAWRMFDWPRIGVQFTLHDADLRPVWELAFPTEIRTGKGDDDDARPDVECGVFGDGEVGHFAVALTRSKLKIHFAAEIADGKWNVRELSREPWPAMAAAPDKLPAFADMPVVELEPRGEYPLRAGTASSGPLRDVQRLASGPGGVLRFVRAEPDGTWTFVRVDTTGKALSERPFTIPAGTEDVAPRFWSIGPATWLATRNAYGEGARPSAWRVDEATGEVTSLEHFDSLSVDDACGAANGGFVVLGTRSRKYTSTEFVIACRADGTTVWSRASGGDPHAPGELFSPEAVAVTTSGSVAVLDVIRHSIALFSQDGTYERTIDVDAVLGHEASYPSGLFADVDGGLVVHDFQGEPSLLRVGSDGKLRAGWTPRFPDGRKAHELEAFVVVASDGASWTSDGQRLLRLGADGVVAQQLGTPADPDALTEPCATAVDVFGRVLVQDKGTGAVHVFDGHGKPLFVCRPDPKDFVDPNSIATLAATHDRGVVAEGGGHVLDETYVRFGPTGARLGVVTTKGWSDVVFSPKDPFVFGAEFQAGFARLASNEATGELRAVERFDRTPGKLWFTGVRGPAVAVDGAVAVLANGSGESEDGLTRVPMNLLVIYDQPRPDVGRSYALPADFSSWKVALGREWAVAMDFKAQGLLVRRTDGRCVRFDQTRIAGKDGNWRFGFDEEGKELVAVGGKPLRILHFAVP